MHHLACFLPASLQHSTDCGSSPSVATNIHRLPPIAAPQVYLAIDIMVRRGGNTVTDALRGSAFTLEELAGDGKARQQRLARAALEAGEQPQYVRR